MHIIVFFLRIDTFWSSEGRAMLASAMPSRDRIGRRHFLASKQGQDLYGQGRIKNLIYCLVFNKKAVILWPYSRFSYKIWEYSNNIKGIMYKRIFDIENKLDEGMFLFGARQTGKSTTR